MNQLLKAFGDAAVGVTHGFDRIVDDGRNPPPFDG